MTDPATAPVAPALELGLYGGKYQGFNYDVLQSKNVVHYPALLGGADFLVRVGWPMGPSLEGFGAYGVFLSGSQPPPCVSTPSANAQAGIATTIFGFDLSGGALLTASYTFGL